MTTFLVQLASAATAPSANVQANGAATEHVSWLVDLAGNLAWPLAALVIALILWRPLSDLVASGRITKLSILNVGIELTPATSATDTPLLNELGDANVAHISDSSSSMLEQVQAGTPADFAVIDIGQGKEWLTSRLYIAAIMLSRMRGARVFVFVETTGSTRRRFIAVARIDQLRWTLASRYPWLEAAWVNALTSLVPNLQAMNPNSQGMIGAVSGAVTPHEARRLTNAFIQNLQKHHAMPVKKVRAPAGPPPLTPEWVQFDDGRAERAEWVTHELLMSLLPAYAFHAWTPVLTDAPRARRNRAVLRRSGDFIALLDDDRSFLRLVNRRVVLEELAAAFGEEPDDRSKA